MSDLTNETPTVKAGASRDFLGGLSRGASNLENHQAQFLALAYAVRPELAVMLAAFAFGGNGNA